MLDSFVEGPTKKEIEEEQYEDELEEFYSDSGRSTITGY
jgi:hypothetical protein